jgi:hypothetical protein
MDTAVDQEAAAAVVVSSAPVVHLQMFQVHFLVIQAEVVHPHLLPAAAAAVPDQLAQVVCLAAAQVVQVKQFQFQGPQFFMLAAAEEVQVAMKMLERVELVAVGPAVIVSLIQFQVALTLGAAAVVHAIAVQR